MPAHQVSIRKWSCEENMRKLTVLFIITLILLTACSPVVGPAPLQETSTVELIIPSPTIVPDTATPSPIPATETPEPTPTEEATATATPLPKDYGPDNFPDDVNPLTGEVVDDPDLLDRRPLAVKIQTFPRGQRPDWGVTLADIVYDYYQNSGLTRLYAIFYGKDAEKAGPIRSGRLLDVILTEMYESIFAFGGADRRILARLASTEIADQLVMEGSSNCPPMCREEPNTYNYLVTNTEQLSEYATSQGVENGRQTLDGMSFQLAPPSGGEPGTQVTTRYSISAYNRWEYDDSTGRYLRFQDTQEADTEQDEEFEPFTDRLNNEQVSSANVVILLVPTEDIIPSQSTEIINIKLTGKGTAYAFRDGQVYKVTWNAEPDKVLYLTNPDGSPFPFKQGNTWFEVTGQNSIVNDENKDQGEWRFEFRIP
jgi:hypothetical protein